MASSTLVRFVAASNAAVSRAGFLGTARRWMSGVSYPDDRVYHESHEWIKVEGDIGVVGITTYAATQLGDVVYVDLPEPSTQVEKDGTLAAIESVKAASDIYSPISGEVVEVNSELSDQPSLVNSDAHGKAWIAKVKLSNKDELQGLMSAAEYAKLVEEESS
uniref:Glycine cleavage system H protein n=1 Tax=Compsopogon caeruleus TaxID=31354 RepID=A0A7S1THM0_9RHOD|mmetsp:Transcript_8163/g.16448  ORF Transcript_8163/g.16448 Transcript_8163/m.16448 type:complete len:162 (+) Transcript_8163:54-539(+)|eukprot:CAMPEP_0184678722 /NCGR_PEP_ID=MMETSP0312-20130426/1522_1 /TAXON_ID=31354 /ORGANISM="Compsopogon coeruleus, Strain SAG 36.94" /LENGTH=161 /DNA_ID=CAMNT_0027127689 /DNA_START=43 /DNA_END=528 /DNA_ORIENTATION=+